MDREYVKDFAVDYTKLEECDAYEIHNLSDMETQTKLGISISHKAVWRGVSAIQSLVDQDSTQLIWSLSVATIRIRFLCAFVEIMSTSTKRYEPSIGFLTDVHV